jgi:hypothetical protein
MGSIFEDGEFYFLTAVECESTIPTFENAMFQLVVLWFNLKRWRLPVNYKCHGSIALLPPKKSG